MPIHSLTLLANCQKAEEDIFEQARYGQLKAGRGWLFRVDLGNQIIVPKDIVSTNLRPDLVLSSETQQTVCSVNRNSL